MLQLPCLIKKHFLRVEILSGEKDVVENLKLLSSVNNILCLRSLKQWSPSAANDVYEIRRSVV
jgi:hypothetical protein